MSDVTLATIINIKAILSDSIGVASAIEINHIFNQQTKSIATGDTSDTVNVAFTINAAISAGGTDTYNLNDGSLLDVLKEIANFNYIHLLAISNTDDTYPLLASIDNIIGTDDLSIPIAPGGDSVLQYPGGSSEKPEPLIITGTPGTTYKLLVVGQNSFASSSSSSGISSQSSEESSSSSEQSSYSSGL